MLDVGFISHGELLEAKRDPAAGDQPGLYYSPDWFLDYAYKETLALIEEQGLTSDYVIEVKTTTDRRLQQAAQRIVNEELETEAPAYNATQAALVSHGARRRDQGDRRRAQSTRRASSTGPPMRCASPAPPSSPSSIWRRCSQAYAEYDGRRLAGLASATGRRRTTRGKYAGRITLTNALTHSYNSVPVHLMMDIGRQGDHR